MKTYKGTLNLPTHMSTEHRSALLDRRLKIVNLPYDTFINKYEFVAVRTLRGYLVEAIFSGVLGALFYVLLMVCIYSCLLGYYGAVTVLMAFLILLGSIFLDKAKNYNQTTAEYYIDIQPRT